MIKYEARFSIEDPSTTWGTREIRVICETRDDAIIAAKSLWKDQDNSGVSAWQIGTDGGDTATATAQLWHTTRRHAKGLDARARAAAETLALLLGFTRMPTRRDKREPERRVVPIDTLIEIIQGGYIAGYISGEDARSSAGSHVGDPLED